MTRALIVYESMFGNGKAVASAVADGVRTIMPADEVEVGLAPTAVPDDVSLLVVGGPTHAFGLSRPDTRSQAAGRASGQIVSRGRGLREWLPTLRVHPGRLAAVAYGTHVRRPWLIARLRTVERAIERRFRRLGVRDVLPHESFFVEGMTGPLVPAELERARRWGERLGRMATPASGLAAGERHHAAGPERPRGSPPQRS